MCWLPERPDTPSITSTRSFAMLHSGPAVNASHGSCDLRAAGLRGHHATCVLQHECVGLGQNDSPMMPSDRCCTKALPGKSCIFGPPAGRMQAMKQQGIFLVAYLLLDPDGKQQAATPLVPATRCSCWSQHCSKQTIVWPKNELPKAKRRGSRFACQHCRFAQTVCVQGMPSKADMTLQGAASKDSSICRECVQDEAMGLL